jgi:Flp pilus assembly protein TadD
MERWKEAANELESAVALEPGNSAFHCDLARVLEELQHSKAASAHYKRAFELQPDWPANYNRRAGEALSSKPIQPHQSQRALESAIEICQATDYGNPHYLETLAAAYAAVGRERDARQAALKAIDLAKANGDHTLAERIRERVRTFAAGGVR